MQVTETLKQSILTECEEDHVGLWSIVRDVKDEMPDASNAEIRKETLDALYELLKSGQIEAGCPDSNGRDFHPWPFSANVIVDKIKESWKLGAERPTIGEIVWFTKPIRTSV